MGNSTADSCARLFLFPGVAHCGGGEGPNTFDVLTPVMAWTESGRVPSKIVASRIVNGTVTRSRPVFPYPAVARYTGTGSLDDAANFVSYTPRPQVRDNITWLGSRPCSHGCQPRCT